MGRVLSRIGHPRPVLFVQRIIVEPCAGNCSFEAVAHPPVCARPHRSCARLPGHCCPTAGRCPAAAAIVLCRGHQTCSSRRHGVVQALGPRLTVVFRGFSDRGICGQICNVFRNFGLPLHCFVLHVQPWLSRLPVFDMRQASLRMSDPTIREVGEGACSAFVGCAEGMALATLLHMYRLHSLAAVGGGPRVKFQGWSPRSLILTHDHNRLGDPGHSYPTNDHVS